MERFRVMIIANDRSPRLYEVSDLETARIIARPVSGETSYIFWPGQQVSDERIDGPVF